MNEDPAITQLLTPIKNEKPCVHDALMFDLLGTKYSELIPAIKARKEFGIEKYGVALQPNNGRPRWIDAWQEILDLIIYLKKEMIEEWKLDIIDLEAIGIIDKIQAKSLDLALEIQSLQAEHDG